MPKKIITRTREQAYKRWIAALLSGEYEQENGSLCRETQGKLAFCCLGVLCDLAAKDGGAQWKPYLGKLTVHGDASKLPKKIRVFMGMTTEDECALIDANDSDGLSFKDIAKLIRTEIMPKALLR